MKKTPLRNYDWLILKTNLIKRWGNLSNLYLKGWVNRNIHNWRNYCKFQSTWIWRRKINPNKKIRRNGKKSKYFMSEKIEIFVRPL